MAKVLFFNLPAQGHVNPTLDLLRELVAEGEEIHYYCAETFREKIQEAGAVFHPLPFELSKAYSKDFHVLQVIGDVLEYTIEMLPDLLKVLEKERYDYVISDFFTAWGFAISQLLGLKIIVLRPVFAMNRAVKQPKAFHQYLLQRPLRTIAYWLRVRKLTQTLANKYPALPKFRLENMFHEWPVDALHLVFTTRLFQPHADLFDERKYKFIGNSAWMRPSLPSDFPWEEIDPQRPLLLISLGSIINNNLPFFKTCVEAFRNSKFQVVMSIGEHIRPEDLELPSNFIARPFLPQIELLKKAAVFITHGGMNSVVEGIVHEVPLLVIPQVSDQFMVAAEVERGGLGIWWKGKLSPKKIEEKVEELYQNPQIMANLSLLRASFEAAGGAKQGAAEIFKYLR